MVQQSPSQVLQNLFNVKKLPYGAQYEINRLVSVDKLTYDDILIEDIDKLAKMGTNREAAPATAKTVKKNNDPFDDDSEGMRIYYFTSLPLLTLFSMQSTTKFCLPRNVPQK
jgi:hypothetical protein